MARERRSQATLTRRQALAQVHFPVPDPAAANSALARAHFALATRIALGFVALLWAIWLLDWAFDVDPDPFGVRPRELVGLLGVLFAPLFHNGFAHIAANTLPLVVLGTAMLYLYPSSALRALPVIYVGPGLAVWVFGRGAVHLGASGIIYGLLSYVFVAGLLRGDRRAIAASLIVAFMYGSLTLGLLPTPPEISWETHLAAAIIGALLALALRRFDVLPPKRYAWEAEHASGEGQADLAPSEHAMQGHTTAPTPPGHFGSEHAASDPTAGNGAHAHEPGDSTTTGHAESRPYDPPPRH